MWTTRQALQCFLGSFDQNPEPVPTAIVSGSSAGSRRSLSRSRSLSRQSPSRTSSASSAASSTVVRASVSSEAPTSADSKASASRKSVGLRPTQRGRHAPASKPPRPGSTSSSASGSSRPTSSRAKPPIPIRPKSVGLSRPNSVRLQERLATAAGEGGAGTRLSMSSRHSTDSLPPLPPEAYHATPQTVEEIESPPIVPPRPKSLPIPSDDDEDGVHGAAMKRDAKSSPAAGRVIPRGGLSGEFAAIIIAGAPSGNAGSGDDGDASDDDGPLPVAPPRRARCVRLACLLKFGAVLAVAAAFSNGFLAMRLDVLSATSTLCRVAFKRASMTAAWLPVFLRRSQQCCPESKYLE